MVEFIQANITWIALGLVFVLMMRMHGGSGAGCCGGHQIKSEEEPKDKVSMLEGKSVTGRLMDRLEEKDSSASGSSPTRSGSCH